MPAGSRRRCRAGCRSNPPVSSSGSAPASSSTATARGPAGKEAGQSVARCNGGRPPPCRPWRPWRPWRPTVWTVAGSGRSATRRRTIPPSPPRIAAVSSTATGSRCGGVRAGGASGRSDVGVEAKPRHGVTRARSDATCPCPPAGARLRGSLADAVAGRPAGPGAVAAARSDRDHQGEDTGSEATGLHSDGFQGGDAYDPAKSQLRRCRCPS